MAHAFEFRRTATTHLLWLGSLMFMVACASGGSGSSANGGTDPGGSSGGAAAGASGATSGASGAAGAGGGLAGAAGTAGQSGAGQSGASGSAGQSGASGMSGASGSGGQSGAPGTSGASGTSGGAGQAGGGAAGSAGSGGNCTLAATLGWSSTAPLIVPVSDATHDLVAVKDPTVVRFNDRWHVYASSVSRAGAYNMIYTSFSDFSQAASAPFYYMDRTPGFNTYIAAPELFYFTPQRKWYLVFQSGPPMYSTNDDPGNPGAWTPPAPFFASTPAIITQNGGWLDFWVICDASSCHLFFSDDHGRFYQSKTTLANFPRGFGDPQIVMQDAEAGRLFEASNVYKLNGANQYLVLIEAFDASSNYRRYFRSWTATSLDGPWQPRQSTGTVPFAGLRNVTFGAGAWSSDISHGEMIRAGFDETLAVDPCDLRYLYQGFDPSADTSNYNAIPWRLGLLTQNP